MTLNVAANIRLKSSSVKRSLAIIKSREPGLPVFSVRSADFTKTTKIRVGPEGREFIAYTDLLCHFSSYFRAALNTSFKEGIEQTIVLEDESAETFVLFLQWLLTRKLDQSKFSEDIGDLLFDPLCRLYVFADKRGVSSLKNAVVNTYLGWIGAGSEWGEVEKCTTYVFNNTTKKSPLRLLMARHFIHTMSEDILGLNMFGETHDLNYIPLHKYPQDFTNMVIAEMCRYMTKSGEIPWDLQQEIGDATFYCENETEI